MKRYKVGDTTIKHIHQLCKRCKNFVDSAELAYDCHSKECPSTNKRIKVDSWGPDKSREPTWVPNDENLSHN